MILFEFLSSDHSLNQYGVDIFDQNNDFPLSSPLPHYSTHLPYNGTVQNGAQNDRYKVSLRDGGLSRYSDLIYDVQSYSPELQQRKDNRRRDRNKQKYFVRSNRPPLDNDRYSDSPDIWRNQRWKDAEEATDDVEPNRRLAWKDPREDGKLREMVVVNEYAKVR